jgi:excisionase family DNA binding protein
LIYRIAGRDGEIRQEKILRIEPIRSDRNRDQAMLIASALAARGPGDEKQYLGSELQAGYSPPMMIQTAALPMAPSHFEPLLTPAEAASYLRIHQKTAIRMARNGVLPALRVGVKHWRFRRSDLVAWAASKVSSSRQPAE